MLAKGPGPCIIQLACSNKTTDSGWPGFPGATVEIGMAMKWPQQAWLVAGSTSESVKKERPQVTVSLKFFHLSIVSWRSVLFGSEEM